MPIIIQLLAALSGLIHILIFVMESVLWMNPKVHSRFLVKSEQDADIIQLFITNQGFYNLFLVIGIFIGLFMMKRNITVAKTLLGYISGYMVAAAVVLVITAPALIKGFFVQGLAPLIVFAYLAYCHFRRAK